MRNDLVNIWPKDKDVAWMKTESWKGLFDGEFEVNVGIDSVLLLKECRNLHSTRVSATIGMWEICSQTLFIAMCILKPNQFSYLMVILYVNSSLVKGYWG